MTGHLTEGQLLADYEILAVAGSGGMGVVYKAMQRSLGRAVALKVIRSEVASMPEYRERFLREARLAASVDHPNVVSVFDVGNQDGHLYLAMQWVDGRDLGGLIGTFGPRSPDRAAAVVVQVASALDAVHRAGLIHRDVKPSNVLVRDVDEKDHAYLTDFGVAKAPQMTDQLTRAGWVVGTAGYLSPEQIMGHDPDERSDLYALGCLFFETLTGRPPFTGENEMAMRWAHAHNPRPKPSDVLPELGTRYDAFVARALAVDPQRRFTTGREFAFALDATHDGRATEQAAQAPGHASTAIGPPTPIPPMQTPAPGPVAYGYATPPPPYPQQARSGSPLALIVLGIVALTGIAVGALAAAGVFSHSGASTQTTTSAITTTSHTSVGPHHRRLKPNLPAGGGTPTPATTSCGGDLSVGPNTSCGFAQNVEQAYAQSSGGDTNVSASSPATGQTYTMHCTGGSQHVCTGGNNASVYFASGPAAISSTTPSAPSGTTSCGGGLAVGPNTSCGFAQNVMQAYQQSGGGDTSVAATSPATGQTYTMHCTGGSPHVCTGGNNASVQFP